MWESDIVIYILLDILYVFILYIIYDINFSRMFSKRNYSKVLIFASYLVGASILTVAVHCMSLLFGFLLYILSLGLFCSIFYHGKYKKKIFISIFFVAIFTGIVTFTSHFMPIISRNINHINSKWFFENIMISALELIGLYFSMRIIGANSKSDIKNYKVYKASYILPIISIIFYGLLLDMLLEDIMTDRYSIIILSLCIFILVCNALSYIIIDRISFIESQRRIIDMQVQKNNLDIKYTKKKIEEEEYRRNFLHDIKKHLNVIFNLSKNGKNEEINSILTSLIDNLNNISLKRYTSSDVVNAILSDKISISKNIEIDNFTIDIDRSTDFSHISDVDLIIILSNLLDNSIEAVKNLEKKEIKLFIRNSSQLSSMIIRVENTFDADLELADNVVIRKNNCINKGIGLLNVKKSVEKYNGIFSINIDDDRFIVNIILNIV